MPCPHGRQLSKCKDCGGSSFCEHGRRRSVCKECGTLGAYPARPASRVREVEGKVHRNTTLCTQPTRVQARHPDARTGGKVPAVAHGCASDPGSDPAHRRHLRPRGVRAVPPSPKIVNHASRAGGANILLTIRSEKGAAAPIGASWYLCLK
eukprot:scaffold127133_cov51-Phaeocystis_antarctica.AAC.1